MTIARACLTAPFSLCLLAAFSAAEAEPFRTIDSYATGEYPSAATTRDFNNDGVLDIATANLNDQNVSVLLGKPDGTFSAATTFAIGASAVELASADLNSDGNADLVVSDGMKSIAIALGNGAGGFNAPTIIQVGLDPRGIAIADLNHDGKLDLAIALHGVENNTTGDVVVMLGNGNGTFASPILYKLDHKANHLVATDLNGDGKLDLAVSVDHFGSPKNGLAILLGNGDGTFQAATTSVAGDATDVAAADLNGDGKMDVVLAGTYANVVRVLLGNGDGTFQAAVAYPATGTAVTVSAADLNNDGIVDLIAGGVHAAVLLGNGDGTFQSAVPYAVGLRFARVADFNGDGNPDIVAGDGFSAIGIGFGDGDGTFRAGLAYPLGTSVSGFATADFNRDGNLDVAAGVSGGASTVAVLLGDGSGNLSPGVSIGTLPVAQLFTGDFNGDGKADILFVGYAGFGSTAFNVYPGNGDGTFQALITTTVPIGGDISPTIADYNHDSIPDLAVTFFEDKKISILLGNGDGTFRLVATYATGTYPGHPVAGDFDENGTLDLAVPSGSGISIYTGNGDGTFKAPHVRSKLKGALAAADVNQDGKVDLVVSGTPGKVLLGNGDGTFAPALRLPSDTDTVRVADVNDDGKPDVMGSTTFGGLIYLRGRGNGTFAHGINVPTGSEFTDAPVLGDLNGDGRPEAIMSDLFSSIVVLLNTTGP